LPAVAEMPQRRAWQHPQRRLDDLGPDAAHMDEPVSLVTSTLSYVTRSEPSIMGFALGRGSEKVANAPLAPLRGYAGGSLTRA